jgi:geranylgeranyl pyrophosphate synthase
MRALTTIHETEGLDEYLEEIEQRLLDAVSCHPGLAATVGAEALAAGGKRLRPLLVFLAATPNR